MINLKLYEQFKDLGQNQLDFNLKKSCMEGNLEEVKYLLTSTEISLNAKIGNEDEDGFCLACSNGHLEIVNYLIFEIGIEETNTIREYLIGEPNKQVANMFELRTLNNQLNQELNSNKINNNKMKV